MRACLQTFHAGIEELEAFLIDAEQEAALVGLLLREDRQMLLMEKEKLIVSQIAQARTDKKRYIYTVAIVVLYGLLERYIASLIERFVVCVSGFATSYAELPAAIQKNHVLFSLELVKAILEDKYRREPSKEDVIANLHACMSGASEFHINGAAFVLHRGNITLDRISNFLGSVGIEAHLKKVITTTLFSEFLRTLEPERDFMRIPDVELRRIFEPIDDLVERRNQVSHGVIELDDIDSVYLLKERCRFIGTYGAALYEVVVQDVIRHEIAAQAAQRLGDPIAVFNDSIVCFDHASCHLEVGDLLVAATGDQLMPFRFGPVSDIQIEKVSHRAIALSGPTKFGVKVPYQARDKFSYYVLPSGTL